MVNLMSIVFEQAGISLPLLFGAYISFALIKVPDLSIESAYLFGALFAVYPLQLLQGYPPLMVFGITLLVSMLGGLLVGATSSSITYFGKIPHLLSSIITVGLCHGLFQLLSPPYASLAAYENPLIMLPYLEKHPEFFTIVCICLGIVMALAYGLRAPWGYSLAILGDNPTFFSYFKVHRGFVFITGIMMANALAGISGYLFAQTNSFVEMNMGLGRALFCITALILGKAIIAKKSLAYLVPVVGSLVYFFLQQLLLKCGFNLKYFTSVQAGLILVILLLICKRTNTKIDLMGVEQ